MARLCSSKPFPQSFLSPFLLPLLIPKSTKDVRARWGRGAPPAPAAEALLCIFN